MQRERQNIYTQDERLETTKLRTWFDAHGIKAVLFDFDDTLLDSFTHERTLEDSYIAHVAENLPAVDRDELVQSFRDAHDEAFRTHSVSHERWYSVIVHLIDKYGGQTAPIFYGAKPILDQIRLTAPNLLPGALDALKTIRPAIQYMGLVTHADTNWTNIKLTTHDLWKYFDQVTCADPFGQKTSIDWKRTIDALGVKPEEVLVIGDNIIGDIQEPRLLGVKHTVLLPSPWSAYTLGDVPEKSMRASEIGDVIGTILNHP